MPSLNLGTDALCDLELLLNRGFFPLLGYMDRANYESVLEKMRLTDGTFWPLPITLAVNEKLAASLSAGCQLALRDSEGFMLAVLTVSDVWQPDLEAEAEALYGTADANTHPSVAQLYQHKGDSYVGGQLEGIHFPQHYDFSHLRRTPAKMQPDFFRTGLAAGRQLPGQRAAAPHAQGDAAFRGRGSRRQAVDQPLDRPDVCHGRGPFFPGALLRAFHQPSAAQCRHAQFKPRTPPRRRAQGRAAACHGQPQLRLAAISWCTNNTTIRS